jgi:hypothetical protein
VKMWEIMRAWVVDYVYWIMDNETIFDHQTDTWCIIARFPRILIGGGWWTLRGVLYEDCEEDGSLKYG